MQSRQRESERAVACRALYVLILFRKRIGWCSETPGGGRIPLDHQGPLRGLGEGIVRMQKFSNLCAETAGRVQAAAAVAYRWLSMADRWR